MDRHLRLEIEKAFMSIHWKAIVIIIIILFFLGKFYEIGDPLSVKPY